MAIIKRKRNLSDKIPVIYCVVIYGLLALFILGLFLFNKNYNAIYDCPSVSNAKVDFSGVDITTRDVACNLAGEWEFYYGKWIVTDNLNDGPDGMIKLPDVWSYKNYGNGRLPKTGYASYRMVANNVQKGINVIVYRHYTNCAYRVFINGKLNYRSGVLSKNQSETVVTGSTDEQIPYLTDGSPLEIVIELSEASNGGFNVAPWIAATSTGISYGTGLRSTNYFALGITTAAVLVSILSCLFFRFKRDLTLPAFMVALYLHFLASRDMLFVFKLGITEAMILELFSAIIAFPLLILHLKRSGAKFNKTHVMVTSVLSVVLTVLLLVFYGTPLAPVFGFLLIITACTYLVPLALSKAELFERCVYGILFMLLISVFFFEAADALGLLVFGTEFIFTFELMFIIICFACVWLWKMAKTARNAMRVSELECELSTIKNQALKAQIKPHFIYNSLTAIQSRYRDGLVEGDKAVESFAKYLRLVTDSDGEDIIPFYDEVKNVMNYFELENLRANGKLNLLLDLEYTDFRVPVLSIQPLVENAVRHGGLRDKKDGYIQLSSKKGENSVVISVSDNGKGFLIGDGKFGVGLENTRKRFELMHGEMKVVSEIGGGTSVTIEIPLEQ